MKHAGVFALLLAALVALPGCGVGRGSAVALEPGDPVRIGVLPVADFVTVYVALEEGYFEDEGLTVETQTMQNAAAIAPSVINGQLQFGTGAITPVLAGAQKGLPLKVVANQADVAEKPEEDVSALLVAPDSGIIRPRDLEGRTVGVNGLGSIVHVAAAAAVERDGGDPSKVTFVAMPFPDMAAAVGKGTLDAASVVEPFVGLGTANGLQVVDRPYYQAFEPGESMSVLFTAGPFAEENPEVVAKVRRAVERASVTAAEDPQVVRDALVEYGGMKPEAVARMGQPPYGVGVDPQVLTAASETMVDLGFLPAPVDGEELVLP
ncbi:ABC transporter substrate-binding protein [Kocuria sp. M1R5S2]|uniref:ABC transporter substrate-binding protein n=1 Tax=Kocuria rhizosphaerae TaxID=3376285 RepID=UPI00379F7A34